MNMGADFQLPLEVATVRVATELNGLRERLERVEHGLEVVFVESDNVPSGQTLGMLQELDVLQQSVGALADYLVQISSLMNGRATVCVDEAVKVVPLREMASRLNGIAAKSNTSGTPELF
ncbi:hypothetical protein [Pelagimonas varians]|uniref:Uncharacterized protein n=1 Tax=Pelagimonas varians TaxID=696760 RepID=A0A238KVC9_9RHOB|nr:hypothetical protein [Pelagimonas varians]PYG28381.1 hypothetical protein C8N36_112156 [Pelagimonas varians]SMX46648.1 hypothetical protein PEV8663_03357 [Pelagimonas varians]